MAVWLGAHSDMPVSAVEYCQSKTDGIVGMIYGSVCSGIEAASVAWEPLGWSPAFFAEVDKFPSAVLAHHYGSNMPGEDYAGINGVPNYGDMSKFKEWPDHANLDVLVGGTPCQSFSVAGLRKGMDDPRGNLALVYLGLAARYRPRWLVWENVPGVLSSNRGRDFGSFLGGLGQLGYGFAYRVLDAQYVRVDGFARAVPQRRRRVFVVGYLGDCRRAGAVLLEPEGLRRDPAPRREAGEGVAPTISARTKGGGGLGTDFECDGGLIPQGFGGGNTSGPIDVAASLAAHGVRQDFEVETFVAHTLRGEGFDAGEDGSGRGTPLVTVPVADTLVSNGDAHSGFRDEKGLVPVATAFSIMPMNSGKDYKARETEVAQPIMTAPVGGNQGGDYVVDPIAWSEELTASENVAGTIQRGGSGGRHDGVMTPDMAVRRLTPRECERLQGFPDDYTLIPYRGKDADDCPDGPRYKALGNSMAVNVMRWIGARIDLFEKTVKTEI
jgi:DNA (cytosine-5)-methyltransferase 1